MHARFARRFTLIELLVVIGIIIIMTALALPAVSKFLKGQRLQQSGRIMQSAFNEARRAAITQRTRNYLVFYKTQDELGQLRYGAQRFRDRFGYEGTDFKLLPNVVIDEENPPMGAFPAGSTARARGLRVPIFDNTVPDQDTGPFTNRRPDIDATTGWIEFRKDGTINLTNGPLLDHAPSAVPAAAVGLFNLNQEVILNNVMLLEQTADAVDMSLHDQPPGSQNVTKRAFIDIDPNTGRVRFRVLEELALATTG